MQTNKKRGGKLRIKKKRGNLCIGMMLTPTPLTKINPKYSRSLTFSSPCSTNPSLHISAPKSLNIYLPIRSKHHMEMSLQCGATRAGSFRGSVVRGCILLSTTSKVLCPSGSFLFHHRTCAIEACREDQPFPPSYHMMYPPNSPFWEVKPKKPCSS